MVTGGYLKPEVGRVDALQIITEPRRREILRLAWDRDRSVSELAGTFGITLGAVSQHLALLREAGYVTVTRDGNRRLYRVDQQALARYRGLLEALWASSLDDLVTVVEQEHPGPGRGRPTKRPTRNRKGSP
jgi:DNA-binding transcriptional ArsR family regulator